MTHWASTSFHKWISDGCDIKSAAEVKCLAMPTSISNNDIGLLKHFVNLRYLNISSCNLSAIPEEVWELTQLEDLYIQKNNICEISPKIKNLTNLKFFDCRYNNLTAFPVEICQLTKLNNFIFNGNKLDILDSNIIDFITQINIPATTDIQYKNMTVDYGATGPAQLKLTTFGSN